MPTSTSRIEAPSGTGADRRAHPRHTMALDALVTAARGDSWSCNVRDFCLGGMFLAFKDQSTFPQPGAVNQDDGVEIHFALFILDSEQKFSLQARVARVFERGMGVSFIDPSPTALQALQFIASTASPARQDGTLGESTSGAEEPLASCRALVATHLPPSVHEFFHQVNARLVASVEAAETDAEQTEFVDTITELQQQKVHIETEFCESVLNEIATLGSLENTPGQGDEAEMPSQISLVEKDEFEDLLAVSDMISKVEPLYEESLFELEERLGHLTRVPVNKDSNPIGPAVLSRHLRDAVHGLTTGHAPKQVIYKAFKSTVLVNLGELYDELNASLIKAGILPELSYAKMQHERASSSLKQHSLNPMHGVPECAEPDDGSVSEISDDSGQSVSSEERRPSSNVGDYDSSSAQLSGAHRAAGQREEMIQDAYSTARKLLNLQRRLGDGDVQAGSMRATMPEPVDSAGLADGTSVYTPRELMDAVGLLQQQGGLSDGDATTRPDLRTRVLGALQNGQVDSEEKAIGTLEDDVLTMIGNLFGAMQDDTGVPELAKPWIKELEVPLLRLAMQDPEFLSSKSHPARKVINQLGRLGVPGVDGDSTLAQRAQEKVGPLMERINKEYKGDVGVFSQAVSELDALVAEKDGAYQENLERVVEACEDQQALVKARQASAGEGGGDGAVTSRVGGSESSRKVPEEWNQWLNRVKRLNVGARLSLPYRSEVPEPVDLAWVGDDHSNFVFVDSKGEKAESLSLQELAMQMRRGQATVMHGLNQPVMDRGLFGMLEKMHGELAHQATHDELTGLVNRKEFETQLERVLTQAKEEKSTHVLCYMDLDQFKIINDTCGHVAGDALLKEIGQLLQQHMTKNGTVARLGGDEFGILLENCTQDEGFDIADRQREAIQQFRFPWEGRRFSVGVSTGLISITDQSDSVTDLLMAVDSACFAAKDQGRNCIQVYHADDSELARRSGILEWMASINDNLDSDRLQLRCQKISPTTKDDAEKPHYEVLLGVRDEHDEPIPTEEFVRAAEQYNYMPAVDRWVVRNVFRWMADNRRKLARIDGLAINLSGRSFSDGSLMSYVLEQFNESKVPPGKVFFEVTETAAISSLSNADEFIRVMKEFGCRFSLDDFGSGHSSYAYLRELPVDYVKIDGSFVKDIDDNPKDYAVVNSINEIAHFMGKKTIAEHVENDKILECLKEIGVDFAQGYGIAMPCLLEEVEIA